MKNDYIVKKTYYSFVVSAILTSLTATVGILIDNIIVGQYLGPAALGAMGIVGPVTLIFSAIGNLCCGGATRAAQALGKGRMQDVNVIFSTNVIFILGIGIVLTAAGILMIPQIATVLGAAGALYEPTKAYLYGYFWGTVPTILLSVMMAFIRIDGSPKLPFVCMGVMSGCNIVLDLLMVGVFRQGMFGMSLATTISYYLAIATACTHFLKQDASLKLVRPQKFFAEWGKTALTGMPTAISRISDTMKIMILNNLMVTFVSVNAVTALNVRMQANNFLYSVIIGIAQASAPVIGMFYGEEDKRAVKDTLNSTFRLGLCTSLGLMAIFLAVPDFFSHLLGVKDPEIARLTRAALRYFALGLPLTFLNVILINFYQATKRVALSTGICILQSFVFTVSLSVALIQPMGSTGVWLAFLLGEALTLLCTVVFIFVRNKKLSLSPRSIMMLGEDFGGPSESRLELSIGNSMEEVMTISSGIHQFAEGRQINARMTQLLALAVEEIAGNVVKHSFTPGQKRWLDMTVLDKDDRVIVCFRDNGKAFDTVAYAAAHQTEQEHLGIRLIYGLADKFTYRRVMGLNCVAIHFMKQTKAV